MKWKVILAVFFVLLLFGGLFFLIFGYDRVVYPLKYRLEIIRAGEEFGVDAALIASVINAESGFNERAVSSKGAVGLMQLLPSTAEWVIQKMRKQNVNISSYSAEELFNPQTNSGQLFDPNLNIQVGTFYLSYLLNKFENVDVALAAYNAGPTNVRKWLKDPALSENGVLSDIPFDETRDYIDSVLEAREKYKELYFIQE
jgi:soluble lytic murein transglycosylase